VFSSSPPRRPCSGRRLSGTSSSPSTIWWAQPPTRITTLPNQLKVATNDVAAHIQSVGVTVAAGSRYEVEETRGYSYMLAKMAFKVRLLPSARPACEPAGG
jgi:hypothetical protein